MPSSSDGHRKRLRKRFITSGFSGFLDYEIIELLLTLGIPRKDCKSIAKELIGKYKTVNAVVSANEAELMRQKGLGQSSIFGIKLARELDLYLNTQGINEKKQIELDVDSVTRILSKEIGYSKNEIFKVVCLDIRGRIVSDTVSQGVLDMSVVHPREVFRIAIDNNASSIIVAHNHPSGDTTPSESDIYTTRRLVESGKILDIEVLDHIIVSKSGYSSLSELGYLK